MKKRWRKRKTEDIERLGQEETNKTADPLKKKKNWEKNLKIKTPMKDRNQRKLDNLILSPFLNAPQDDRNVSCKQESY